MPRFDIPFTVSGETQTITATQNLAIRAGSKNYWFATFTFTDNIFEGLEYLSATFSTEPYARSKGRAKIVPIENNQCQVPWEVLTRKGKVYVGIFAGDMLVTNEATFEVTYSAPTLGNESQPTESWYARFETALDAKQDALTAGDGITIDGNVISATGGGIAYVTVNSPFSDIKTAVDAGKTCVLIGAYNDVTYHYPLVSYQYRPRRESTVIIPEYGKAVFAVDGIGELSQTEYVCEMVSGITTWTDKTHPDTTVKFAEQELTTQEQAQARENIGAGTYSKPGGGIPASDLASGVIPKKLVVTYTLSGMTSGSSVTCDKSYAEIAAALQTKTPIEAYGVYGEYVVSYMSSVVFSGSSIDMTMTLIDAADYQIIASQVRHTSTAITYEAVVHAPSYSAPLMDGTASTGSSTDYARADHVHPTDTSRAAASDIPTKVSDLTNDSGFISNTATAYRSASIPMGECDDTSTATAFTATVPGITELRDGVCVWLRNNVVTSASGFTIDINGLGAKPVYSSLAAATRVTTTFNVNYTELLVYNESRVTGGCWDMVYGVDTNTTYTPVKMGFGYTTSSNDASATARTASLSSYALTANAIVAVKFTTDVAAGATLNIASKGAKAIYYRGEPITAGVIKAGDTVTLVYSTYFHVLSNDRWGLSE